MGRLRPTWPERMLILADHWSQYSTCVRRQVGAVIFHPETKAVISIGYNDTPIGATDCGDNGCPRCNSVNKEAAKNYLDCNCVHAEANALMLAARWGVKTEGCHMATTFTVCPSCLKHTAQAGIAQIIEAKPPYHEFYDERNPS